MMGYVSRKHRCCPPMIEGHGDIWQCDDCGAYWRSIAPGNPRYNTWRPLGWFGRRVWLVRDQ